MWLLNRDKLDLAKSKYGFTEEQVWDVMHHKIIDAYDRTIIDFDERDIMTQFGRVTVPRIWQDLIYNLIKDDILILKPESSEQDKLIQKIQNREMKIQALQNEIDEFKSRLKEQ